MVPLKYLSNFWRTLRMPLINWKISLQLKWSRNCIIVAGTTNNQNPTFQINDTKLYVPVVTLSAQENINFFNNQNLVLKEQLIGTNIAKTSNQARNRYLDYLIDSGFQGVNRLFVLSFKDADVPENHKQDYLPNVEIS